MWNKKKKTFREELYLPKRQLKKPKRSENVVESKRSFPWLTLFLWLCFLGTGGYMLFFSPVMKADTLHVEGNSRVSRDRIEELFVHEGETKLWKMAERSNLILFRTSVLQARLLDEFPAIEEIRVTKTFPNKINVFIREREFALLWCSRGPCYLLSEHNVALPGESVPEKKGELPMYTVTDLGGLPVEIGRTLFDYPFIEHFKENKERLKTELGIEVNPEMMSASRFSDELRMKTEAGWELTLNSRIEPDQNIKTLRLFFEQEIPFERQGELRNVDLRTENRIYYSLKDGLPKEGEEEDKQKSEEVDKQEALPTKNEKKKKD